MDIWKTLTVTIVGFVLTGIVGTWISYFWQTRNWRFQQEYNRSRELATKQIETAEKLSNLIGQRKFRMFRAAAALRSRDQRRIEESWKNYDTLTILWNDEVNGYITKLRHFFSKRIQYDLDSEITPEFQYIGSILERVRRKYDKNDFSRYDTDLGLVSARLEEFNGISNHFIGKLWKEIDLQHKKIDGKTEIRIENIEKLSTLYLIKQMFVSRLQA